MNLRYLLTGLGVALVCILIYALIEFLVIKYNGTYVSAPSIPREPQTTGSGPALKYVIMGDSTTIGQGAPYDKSYAIQTTQYLAKNHTVTLVNTGISGARVQNVLETQLSQAVAAIPDIVLLGVGANDTTHFTDLDQMDTSLQKIIDSLRRANPNIKIVLTRSPALDSVSRFPPVSKYALRHRTVQVNQMFDTVIRRNNLIPALIAEKTRDTFIADPTLTAADNFHPNERGYALWVPILNDALDEAVK